MAELSFPPSVINKLKNLGLKEDDVMDVFRNGQSNKSPNGIYMSIKKYPSYGYAIGIYYVYDNYAGGYKITAVWKSERR